MYGSLMIHVGYVFGEIIIVDLRYEYMSRRLLQRQDRLTSFYVMISNEREAMQVSVIC